MNAILTTFAGAAVAGLLSLTPALAQELTDVKLRLAFIPGGVDAPFFLAAKKGYFADEGLNVEITDGNGTTGTIKALMARDFDIGIASLGATAKAVQSGGAADLIATAVLVQKDPSSIIALEGSGITEPKDLEGKRFGTDAGNLEDGMIRAFTEVNGVDMDAIDLVIINGGADRTALLNGDVDFINGWANPDGDKVAAMHPIEPPMLFADYGVNLLGSSVMTRKDWLAENGDVMKGFLAAITRAKADVDADPEEALAAIMEARPDLDPEIIALEIDVMDNYRHTTASEGNPFGVPAEEDIELTLSLLEKYGNMRPGLTPGDIFTADYLP
ncbi:ABC transporter substrate-binding protein [Celeribacter indicus]|uniref:Thiamine pyrimidine synthase n=1 Tax=Celeribacter indicus TaxID=1208324 RepID=A0A0B5E247_9RHOB|nr:ABC transporter substrate-binding protein [Celeribacter indicus]AJE47121.1 sulfonate/nitrate transport system substrate-binding protein [Celeribacter indicus]SDW90302.1 NitT/TauT family transport system substrate-binding protein [Celeribacter indicus]